MRIGFPAGVTKWEKELRQRAVLVRAILTRRNEMGQAAQVIAYMDKERPVGSCDGVQCAGAGDEPPSFRQCLQ